jgi:tyrosine-protein kinase Etk/Wzc
MGPTQIKEIPIRQDTDQPQPQPVAQNDLVVDFGELSASLVKRKWLIVSAALLALLISTIALVVSPPIYRAEGLLQIEKTKTGMEMLDTLQPLLGEDANVSAEVQVLGSRMILGQVVKKLKLDIDVSSKTFPLIGDLVVRRYKGESLASPWLGLSSFAWGGEILQVDAFEVPDECLDQPYLLVAGDEGAFSILDEDGKEMLSGIAGTRISNNGFSIFVVQIQARKGTRFQLTRLSEEMAVKDLRDRFSIKEQGAKSGILKLSLSGKDANKIKTVLDEIQNTFLRRNVDRRSAQAKKTLDFLTKQLPILKQQVDDAEAAYNSYRQSRGSLDLSLETQGVLKSIVDIEDATLALKQEREELRQRFTSEHPTIQAVDAKLARLNERHRKFDSEIARLPDTQQTVLRLARDMEVSTNLYTELLNTVQQLKISKAGTVGDVRIIDGAAVSKKPINADPVLILAIALIIGILVGIIIVLLLRTLRVVVDDPETIEAKLGLPVFATVPHSHAEAIHSRKKSKGNSDVNAHALLAEISPDDNAVESLRSLRTTLYFALIDTTRRSILVTSSSPGVGKSFIVNNLGIVLAQLGKRVAIIDADLRRGHINREFGVKRENGISEYIAGQLTITDIVKATSISNLFVVTTGQIPDNPSELLMHSRFNELLTELNAKFDFIIIDSPPVLAVSDATVIGRCVGTTLVAVRAGKHSIPELEQAVKRFHLAGLKIKGFIFNDLRSDRQHKRYGYKGYVFQYSYSR